MRDTITNLLQETLEVLANKGKTPKDVKWVGSSDGEFAITWDDFTEVADIEYDCGYGGRAIAQDLVVVGSNWWLSRKEYDGSEWWEYNQRPKIVRNPTPFHKVKSVAFAWTSLGRINLED